jgi:aspartokinase/homoserine dehydrogenase 1
VGGDGAWRLSDQYWGGTVVLTFKFGGTSVGDGERIAHVARLVAGEREARGAPAVVVSAMAGVTDRLVEAATTAAGGDGERYRAIAQELWAQHEAAAGACLGDAERRARILAEIRGQLDSFEALCRSIHVLGECTPRAMDLISGLGERMSVRLVAGALEAMGVPARALDAGELIVTNGQHGAAEPIWAPTRERVRARVLPILAGGAVPVITGFVGATASGEATTLGRGGSDYSAAIVGSCLDSDEIWIWTDVDGILTADPRLVPGARTLPELGYVEAAELSYFGAKVLHPKTILPAVERCIPVRIKNTFRPEHPGTLIVPDPRPSRHVVKAVTAIRQLSLITVEGRGMMGVPGVAAKVFGAVAREGVNVLMISQSSSEQNICFAVPREASERAVMALRQDLGRELDVRDIERVEAAAPMAIVAVVGAGMRGTPGIAARTFGALARAGINIIAIAQGSSEYNISFCIDEGQVAQAVRLIHDEFDLGSDRNGFGAGA